MSAGSGNDTINAAYGADRVVRRIRPRLHQHRDRRSRGLGRLRLGHRDKVRINNDERKRVKNCERVAVFGNNDH